MNITKEKKAELLNLLYSKKLFGIEYIHQFNFKAVKNNKNKLPIKINELEAYVNNCSLCELYKSKISTSFGNGNLYSKIFFITFNAQLETEKEFKSIKDMIETKLNLDINDIYMTNILKCNTKNYKSSLSCEVEKCLVYLEQQIDILKPELIITFGEVFTNLMKNSDKIIDVSGNLYMYKNVKVIPLMEFDFINKNPSYIDKMNKDILKIKNILDRK